MFLFHMPRLLQCVPYFCFFLCVCFGPWTVVGFWILLFPPLECMFNLDWFLAHDPRLPYMRVCVVTNK